MMAIEEYPHDRLQRGEIVHLTREVGSPCEDARFMELTDTMKGEADLWLYDESYWMEVDWAWPARRRSWHYPSDHEHVAPETVVEGEAGA